MESLERKVSRTYGTVQLAISGIANELDVGLDSPLIEQLQDAIAEYADAEIAIHTHYAEEDTG